jgi:hypothetical protein
MTNRILKSAYIYIYIYIERERERERENYYPYISKKPVGKFQNMKERQKYVYFCNSCPNSSWVKTPLYSRHTFQFLSLSNLPHRDKFTLKPNIALKYKKTDLISARSSAIQHHQKEQCHPQTTNGRLSKFL